MEYRVDLPVFHGPLDLLLYLIRRDELEITDIPIGRITAGYLEYLGRVREAQKQHGFDINLAGDFVVMAATLMEIKSAMLLPEPPPGTGKEGQTTAAQNLADPRYELVKQLLEYKRLKDNAHLLERQQASHFDRFARVPAAPEGDDAPPTLDMDEVQVWDLLEAFTRLLASTGTRKGNTHEVVYDETPIDLHAADIEDRIRREKTVTLRALLVGRATKSEMIGVFLALLELVREKRVLVDYDEQQELRITEAPEEHRRTFQGVSLESVRFDPPPQ